MSWERLTKAVNRPARRVRALSFKYLRKTGGDAVCKLAGLEVSKGYLAHAGVSVAERYYTYADFDKVAAATWQLRDFLFPAFGALSVGARSGPDVAAPIAAPRRDSG